MPVKAVVLDADGVVILGEIFTSRVEREHGIPKEKTMPFFDSVFMECLTGKADLRQELKKVILDWGWKGSTDELLEYWFRGESNMNKDLARYMGELRTFGISIFLATNQEKHRTEFLKNEMGFNDIFDGIFSSCDLGIRKPNPEFFRVVARSISNEFGIGANETVLWDDSQENVDSAIKSGMKAFLYRDYIGFRKTMEPRLMD